MILAILFGLMFLTLLAGLPLPFSIGVASLAAVVALDVPLVVVPQRLVAGMDSFAFLAIPFFLLVGEVMNAGGLTARIIKFANAIVGHMRGGLAQITVVASMFFGGISGSATADLSAIGSILIPSMKKEHYDPEFAVAVTSCAATCGPIIPPSITMIIYGILANVSITQLFLGGYVPGIMMGLSFMLVVYFIARRRNYPLYERSNLRKVLAVTREASGAVILPFIILGGLLSGVFTVTEAAGISAVYAMFISLFVYRDLSWSQLPRILVVTSIKSGVLMTVAASALIFAWVLSYLEVPQMIVTALFAVTRDKNVILLMLNILFLIVGCFMEAKASMLILLPVILPVLPKVGIDLIHFGVVITFNLLVGLITPPVGLCLSLGAKIGDVPLGRAAVAAIPFVAVQLVILFLITYVPGFILWLPKGTW
jgi:tripartite ATP-independent transporter DctM subunit